MGHHHLDRNKHIPSPILIRSLRERLRQDMMKSPALGHTMVQFPDTEWWIKASWEGESVLINFCGAREVIPVSYVTGIGSQLQEGRPVFSRLYRQAQEKMK